MSFEEPISNYFHNTVKDKEALRKEFESILAELPEDKSFYVIIELGIYPDTSIYRK